MAVSSWMAMLVIPLTAILVCVIYFCYVKIVRWKVREAVRNQRNNQSRQNSATVYSIPVGILENENSSGSQKATGSTVRPEERPPSYEDAIKREQV